MSLIRKNVYRVPRNKHGQETSAKRNAIKTDRVKIQNHPATTTTTPSRTTPRNQKNLPYNTIRISLKFENILLVLQRKFLERRISVITFI